MQSTGSESTIFAGNRSAQVRHGPLPPSLASTLGDRDWPSTCGPSPRVDRTDWPSAYGTTKAILKNQYLWLLRPSANARYDTPPNHLHAWTAWFWTAWFKPGIRTIAPPTGGGRLL